VDCFTIAYGITATCYKNRYKIIKKHRRAMVLEQKLNNIYACVLM
jgi:hypothetical protein